MQTHKGAFGRLYYFMKLTEKNSTSKIIRYGDQLVLFKLFFTYDHNIDRCRLQVSLIWS